MVFLLCHTLRVIVVIVLLIYAVPVFAEAARTFDCRTYIGCGCDCGRHPGIDAEDRDIDWTGCDAPMMAAFGSRYMQTRAFFPTGIMMTISLLPWSCLPPDEVGDLDFELFVEHDFDFRTLFQREVFAAAE